MGKSEHEMSAEPDVPGWAAVVGGAAAAIFGAWRGWIALRRTDTKAEMVEGGYRDLIEELRAELQRQDERCQRELAEHRKRIETLEAEVKQLLQERMSMHGELAKLRAAQK